MTLQRKLYQKMFLIRSCETVIREHYFDDEMKTPMHMSMGEEGIVAGVVEAIKPDGQAMGTFRSHGLYLAMTEETDCFFTELYGKQGGTADGKAGSMHLASPEHGLIGCSAIVASSIPVCTGLAFANKMEKNNRIVACFFGDGATEEGVFWESLNLACVMKLPILFVCEDNELAVHAGPDVRRGYASLPAILEKFNCNLFQTGVTTDAEEIYTVAKSAIQAIETTGRPSILYARYYRYLEHVGVNEDFDAGYRCRDTYQEWLKKDPVRTFREKLVHSEGEESVQTMENEIRNQVGVSLQRAAAAGFLVPSGLYEGVFAQ